MCIFIYLFILVCASQKKPVGASFTWRRDRDIM